MFSTEKAMAPHSSTLAWKIPWTEGLEGCSPWSRKESDTTERLHFHCSLSCIGEGNGNPLQCSRLENPRVGHDWSDLAALNSLCLVAQSCPALCHPMDCSPLGSSVRGILQARILEWAAISSSRGSSWPRNRTCVSCIVRRILYHWATSETPQLRFTEKLKPSNQSHFIEELFLSKQGWALKTFSDVYNRFNSCWPAHQTIMWQHALYFQQFTRSIKKV